MDPPASILGTLTTLCFAYPFLMAWYWMLGGILFGVIRWKLPPPWQPPALEEYPLVSVLVPCHNESEQLDEMLGALGELAYPSYEVIAVDDGSTDDTWAKLVEATKRYPWLRAIRLTANQGKSVALNTGAALARSDFLVCIDGDAMLDPFALHWLMASFHSDGQIGAISGNPRIRNRSTLLGKLQVGEFTSIVGLIKRTQTLYGVIFTVSGVICAFRRRALMEVGFWSPEALTDDVDVTLRIQLAGWRAVFEPRALCWILMPETLRGLWKQRLRWSEGGTQALLSSLRSLSRVRQMRMAPILLNYLVSVAWSYLIVFLLAAWFVLLLFGRDWLAGWEMSPIPGWFGSILLFTYLLQSIVSVLVDSRNEAGLASALLYVIWYPLAFWLLQALTAVVGFPRALLRQSGQRGIWLSPDRGVR
jgi:biofilm PGA synthesis N-glycosyltransferase PgaC